LSETVQRLQISGVTDTDSANGRVTPRLNLFAAVNQGTAVSLTGSGPAQGVSGQTATYSITVTNSGALTATDVRVTDSLPASATFSSASSGCTFASSTVTCAVESLAGGASVTLTITVTWSATGPVFDMARVSTDQINSSSQQTLAFGTQPVMSGDGPLPLWSYALLGGAFFALAARRLATVNGSETAPRGARR
jgi:uncharacterized repeat protein (TIGR01451 family)